MNKSIRSGSLTIIFVFIFLAFALSTSAQSSSQKLVPPAVDIPLPFDFADDYYARNGVNPKEIIGRRTGDDGLSVFDKTGNPNWSSVRVIVTIPGYDQNGAPLFWYPLGDLRDNGFMETREGALAKRTAALFPIYVFPDPGVLNFSAFAGTRHAPIVDNSAIRYTKNSNPLGIRQIVFVTYTEKAFTKEGYEIMAYFGKKNGLATDDTPIIKSLDDIQFLAKNEFIKLEYMTGFSDVAPFRGQYAISPMFTDPTKGAIAKDAFLWMATKDGNPLPAEEMFAWHFTCLQEKGVWCE